VRGTAVNVTISGQYLTGTSGVTVSGANVAVSNLNVVNDTTVTATFTIDSAATTGLRNVSLTTPGGTVTLNNAFRVRGATVTFAVTSGNLTSGGRTPKDGVITVTNTSIAANANSSALTLTGAPTLNRTSGTGTFTITGGTCVNGTVVNPGNNTCTVNVHYVPPAAPASVTSQFRVLLQNSGASTNPLQSQQLSGN
jgi:hypothetical protein